MTRDEFRQLKKLREREQRRKLQDAYEAAKGPIDMPFLLLAMMLLAVGMIMLLSASFPTAQASSRLGNDPLYYFKRQFRFSILGLVAMYVVSKINYERFRGLARLGIWTSFVLLLLVIIPGPNSYGRLLALGDNGAARWLGIPGTSMQFQPSEVAKLGIIVYFAERISQKREKMNILFDRDGAGPLVLLLGLMAGMVLIEPHMSGAILILGMGAAMMVVGGIHWKWVALGVTGVACAWCLMAYTDIIENILRSIQYNASRITVWKDPFGGDLEFQRGAAFQTRQSLITIGSGGLMGVGLGKSRQKFGFLPERHNDYIFAIVFEELGLVGGTLIMLLFALLIVRGFWLAIHARDRFGSLLIVGVTTQIALQTFLNIAVVTNLIPSTGISLPFFSYGGTALAIQLVEIGVVLSVSRQIPAPKAG
ncbi:MAG: putative lipid II flippase FtsW [Oscillospiraceae bacterium]|nr:putative lipid II flippase FtsW [Oscillospiraceae bacterium]